MIYLTGDTHGELDIEKLNRRRFPLQRELTRQDYLIICGDFGAVWDGSSRDLWWQVWHQRKPYTTLFVDGNHENHPLLNRFPVEDWMGGRVHRIQDNVLHLMRGQVYTLEGKRFFTFGGAPSHDLWARKIGVSWWPEEVASEEEIEEARRNLDQVGWKVDYVITHTVSQRMIQQELCQIMPLSVIENPTEKFLDEVEQRLDRSWWFAGHFHRDLCFSRLRTYLLYQRVIALTEGFPTVNDPR